MSQKNDNHQSNQESCGIDSSLLQWTRSLMATISLTGVLLFSTPNVLSPANSNHHYPIWTPPTAWAESVVAATTTTTTIKEVAEPTTSIQPLQVPQEIEQEVSVLEEVWTLIDKYYIDRSFNGLVRTMDNTQVMKFTNIQS